LEKAERNRQEKTQERKKKGNMTINDTVRMDQPGGQGKLKEENDL